VLVFASEAPDHQFAAPGVTRVSRQGRTLSLVTRGRLDALRAEALALGAVSVDVSPVSLKDLFLESIAWEVL
jgi:hypothetical protein